MAADPFGSREPGSGPLIRGARLQDAGSVAGIYNHYVRHSVATFEEADVLAEAMSARMERVLGAGLPYLVLERDGAVVGYAYAGPWHDRSAYRYSVETTVYLAPDLVGRGWGARLYERLFACVSRLPVHTAIAGITLPNPASVALHERFGFRQAAMYRAVGRKFGRWLDVGYWQRHGLPFDLPEGDDGDPLANRA